MAHLNKNADTSTPLQWGDLTRSGQRAVKSRHADHIKGLPDEMRRQSGQVSARADDMDVRGANPEAARANRSKASRLSQVADTVSGSQVSLGKAARNRVDVIKQGVAEARLPGEDIPGAGWYFDAAGKAVSEAPDYPPERAIAASSAMSPGTSPEMERSALGALASAEKSGEVKVPPTDTSTQFSSLAPKQVSRAVKERWPANEAVDYTRLGGPQSQNIGKAADILRGNQDAPQDPVANPKTWSYTQDLVQAAEAVNTPVHGEYTRRAGVLSDKMTGKVGKGQMSMDLYGLAGSNEGILSDENHTAEDTWMQSITARSLIPNRADQRFAKGLADVSLTSKGNVSRGNASVSAAGVQHAFNNAATTEAARSLQSEFQMDSTVPSVLVQETAWTAARRLSAQAVNKPNATADREYNAAIKPERTPRQRAQPRLFR